MGWLRKLHNEELRNSPSKIRLRKSRAMTWAGYVERMGEKRKAYRLLVGWLGSLQRSSRRLVDSNKMDLVEIVFGGMDWIDLDQDTDQLRVLVKTVLNLRVA
jgi:hypothetical protein